MNINLSKDSIILQLKQLVRFANRYKVLMFLMTAVVLYGFLIWRINVLAAAEPTLEEKTAAESSIKAPKIDAAVVEKMKNLQDNSVNVQVLFEEARQNPFSE